MRLGRTRSFMTLKGLHSDKTTSVSLNQYNPQKTVVKSNWQNPSPFICRP